MQMNVEVEVWGNLISGNRHYICMKIKYFGQSLINDLSEINSPAKQTYLAYIILPSFGSSNLQVALPCTRVSLGEFNQWKQSHKHIRVCARNWSNWREWIRESVLHGMCMGMTLCTDWRTCVVCVTPYCSAGYIGVLCSHWHCTDHLIFKANNSIRIRMFTVS